MRVFYLLSFAIILFVTNPAHAQKDEEIKLVSTSNVPGRFYIGASGSAEAGFRMVKYDGANAAQSKRTQDSIETVKATGSAGIRLGYVVHRWIALELGVNYCNMGYQSKKLSANLGSVPPYGNLNVTLTYANNMHYIGIPVVLQISDHSPGKSKLKFNVGLGFETQILVGGKNESKFELPIFGKQQTKLSIAAHRVNIVPMISAGIRYEFNSHMMLRIDPVFRFGALNVAKSGTSTTSTLYFNNATRLYSGGLEIGFFYRL